MSKDLKDVKSEEELSFYCRSPIYMCPSCTHAENCRDLLNLLRTFRVEEKAPEFDYMTNFPFLNERTFKQDKKNKMNELSSGEWLTFTRTVFNPKFPHILGHDMRRHHPDYKSPHLIGQLIAFFTKQGDHIVDPFAGTGTSLLSASLLGRDAIGFEINQDWIDIYYKICKQESIERQKLVFGDSAYMTAYIPPDTIDFIVVDPPDPLTPEEWMPEAEPPEKPLEEYFDFIRQVLVNCYKGLKNKKYIAVFTRNLYNKSRYVFMAPYFTSVAEDAGFILKGEKIWENKAEKLRPYGYPHTYVPNIVHYSILIFRKDEAETGAAKRKEGAKLKLR